MSPLEAFQATHGRSWGEIVGHPAFGAALALAQREKLQAIAVLTPEEIQTHGPVILADLVGFLTYEAGLLGLHEPKKDFFSELGPEEYPSPIAEAREEELIMVNEDGSERRVSQFFQPPPPPVLRKKGVPKKKGKRKIKKP